MSSARRKCAKCGRNRAEKFFVSARGRVCADCRKRRVKYANRADRLMELYGITLEEDAAILAAQGGVCAICKGARPYELHVDHDHAIEKALRAQGVPPMKAARMSVRGKLCRQCNRRLLPAAHDSVENLEAAIDYLERWPSNAVLGEHPPDTNVDFVELMR